MDIELKKNIIEVLKLLEGLKKKLQELITA
jgi:hypothetical protein